MKDIKYNSEGLIEAKRLLEEASENRKAARKSANIAGYAAAHAAFVANSALAVLEDAENLHEDARVALVEEQLKAARWEMKDF